MARTATKKEIDVQPLMTSEAAESINKSHQTGAAIIEAARGEQDAASAIVNQRIGRRQMASMVQKLVTVADLVDLQNLKESKGYKSFTTIDTGGKAVIITTWEEYCTLIEGRSRESVDLDLRNLNTLGPELFESMRTVGIGPSTMRAIRQLPDDKQELIQQAVSTKNKDDLAEFIEQIIVKSAKEKEQLTKQLSEAQADIEAKDEVAAAAQKRITKLQEQAVLIKKLPPDEKTKQLCSEIASIQAGLDEEIRTNLLSAFTALTKHSGDDHQAFINSQIQLMYDAVKLLRDEFGGQGVAWEKEAD